MSEQETPQQTLDESFIAYLESVIKRDDRAILAHFRRGLGKAPGMAMEMFPYLARFTQNRFRSEENAYFLVASLIGLYPTYSWKTDEGGRNNLGKSLSFLQDQSESIEKRFVALLNADEEDLPQHLRQIISLLKSKEAPINWLQLLKDIKFWSHENRRVQRNWAHGFWGHTAVDTEKKGEQN